jgi:hypothetical protein
MGCQGTWLWARVAIADEVTLFVPNPSPDPLFGSQVQDLKFKGFIGDLAPMNLSGDFALPTTMVEG